MRRNRLSAELTERLQILKYYFRCAKLEPTHRVRLTTASELETANQVRDCESEPTEEMPAPIGAPADVHALDTEEASMLASEQELLSIMCGKF